MPLHIYNFSVTLLGSLQVSAETPEQAAKALRNALRGASVNAGCWPTGDPILFDVDVEGAVDLEEVDGESPESMGVDETSF